MRRAGIGGISPGLVLNVGERSAECLSAVLTMGECIDSWGEAGVVVGEYGDSLAEMVESNLFLLRGGSLGWRSSLLLALLLPRLGVAFELLRPGPPDSSFTRFDTSLSATAVLAPVCLQAAQFRVANEGKRRGWLCCSNVPGTCTYLVIEWHAWP